jgi:hypothetical protein
MILGRGVCGGEFRCEILEICEGKLPGVRTIANAQKADVVFDEIAKFGISRFLWILHMKTVRTVNYTGQIQYWLVVQNCGSTGEISFWPEI